MRCCTGSTWLQGDGGGGGGSESERCEKHTQKRYHLAVEAMASAASRPWAAASAAAAAADEPRLAAVKSLGGWTVNKWREVGRLINGRLDG